MVETISAVIYFLFNNVFLVRAIKKQIWYQIQNFIFIIFCGIPDGSCSKLKCDAREFSARKIRDQSKAG